MISASKVCFESTNHIFESHQFYSNFAKQIKNSTLASLSATTFSKSFVQKWRLQIAIVLHLGCSKRIILVRNETKRNKIFLHERRFEMKQMGILLQEKQFQTKQNEISFQNISNFSIIAHLCHRSPSKIHITMVNGRSMCLMWLSCKACSSHGKNPTFRGLVSSA